jgi:hypothetical protein
MEASELFDIEPSHTSVAEISRRRLDYGEGYAPAGYATLWLAGHVTGASLGDRASFDIYGVRGEELLVRYTGGCREGFKHGPGFERRTGRRRAEPCFWVHASVFDGGDGIEICARYSQPMPERYWHPNWRWINALPPLRSGRAAR